jgi:hypothetical protein
MCYAPQTSFVDDMTRVITIRFLNSHPFKLAIDPSDLSLILLTNQRTNVQYQYHLPWDSLRTTFPHKEPFRSRAATQWRRLVIRLWGGHTTSDTEELSQDGKNFQDFYNAYTRYVAGNRVFISIREGRLTLKFRRSYIRATPAPCKSPQWRRGDG